MRTTLCKRKVFHGASGPSEYAFILQPPAEADWPGQVAALEKAYADTLSANGLSPQSAVFRRFYLSDSANQYPTLRKNPLLHPSADNPVAVSVVQQPPLSGAKIAMLACHNDGDLCKTRLSPHHLLVSWGGQRHLWSTRLCAANDAAPSVAQAATGTEDAFAALSSALIEQGGSLRQNCLRTWLFVRDVDLYYSGVVAGRAHAFERSGFGPGDATIASTGINGGGIHPQDLVTMDAYASLDLRAGQKQPLNAFDHLCRASDYAVSFERGTKVGYADRARFFISGTASIDADGKVVHPGDVLAQTRRAIENVRALLADGGAALSDMMYWIFYLRDGGDGPRVAALLHEMLGETPFLLTLAPVCRPGWLIECEGVAIRAQCAPALPAF